MGGEPLPVDLAGHGEEHLIHHVDADVDGVDADGRVAATRPPGGAAAGAEPVGVVGVGGDDELDRRATVGDVRVEVLAGQELGVVVDGDHRRPPSKAMPA